MLQSGQNLQACQLYRKAGNFLRAARLLFDVAAEQSKQISPVPLRVKKLYVLAALLVEQHHEQRKAQTGRLDTLGVLEGIFTLYYFLTVISCIISVTLLKVC